MSPSGLMARQVGIAGYVEGCSKARWLMNLLSTAPGNRTLQLISISLQKMPNDLPCGSWLLRQRGRPSHSASTGTVGSGIASREYSRQATAIVPGTHYTKTSRSRPAVGSKDEINLDYSSIVSPAFTIASCLLVEMFVGLDLYTYINPMVAVLSFNLRPRQTLKPRLSTKSLKTNPKTSLYSTTIRKSTMRETSFLI